MEDRGLHRIEDELGERWLTGWLEEGIAEIEVHVNDKATAVFPPYAAGEQRAFIDEERDRVARQLLIWSQADTRRFFLAGGGAEDDFGVHFARGLAALEKIVRGVEDGTYHGIAGGAFYLVAGRKSR